MKLSDLEKMTDDELIEKLKSNLIPDTGEIIKYIGIRLSLIQGKRYLKTGSIDSFHYL